MEEQSAKRLKLTEETLAFIPKLTTPYETKFSDELVVNNAKDIVFYQYPRNMHQLILARFFRFYFTGGLSRPEDNVPAVVFDAIGLSRVGKKALWLPEDFGTANWYPSNNSTELPTRNQSIGSHVAYVNLNRNRDPVSEANYQTLLENRDETSQTKFKEKVERIINQISGAGVASPDEEALLRLTGFLALTLLRTAIKDEKQMASVFKKQYRTNLASVVGWGHKEPFDPPCQQCITVCVSTFVKTMNIVSKIFYKLTGKFIHEMKNERDPSVIAYLSDSVLTHTALNGLGLIRMLDQACTILDLNWTEIRNETYFDSLTEKAWNAIDNFYATQRHVDNIQYGYKWARIINHALFRELTPKEQPFLAMILAGVIAEVQGEGVWQAPWVKKHAAKYAYCKVLGKAIFMTTKQKSDSNSSKGRFSRSAK